MTLTLTLTLNLILTLTLTLRHDGIVDIDDAGVAYGGDDADPLKIEHLSGLQFGNKMAILGGDFLLASACTGLSRLQSAPVVTMMSTAIRDSVEGSFASYQYELFANPA